MLLSCAVGPGSACFAIGRNESGDISEIRFVDCEFTGTAAGTATPTSVTAATNASPIQITTSTPHNLIEHQAVVVSGVGDNNAANVGAFIHIIDGTNFELIGTTGTETYTPLSVTAATNASPIQITTSTPHNLIEHQAVVVSGVGGNRAANVFGAFIHINDGTNFELIGTTGTGTYTSGGTVYGGWVYGGGPFTALDHNFGGSAIPTCEFGVLLNSAGNEKTFHLQIVRGGIS
jgi:hypothetical protein